MVRTKNVAISRHCELEHMALSDFDYLGMPCTSSKWRLARGHSCMVTHNICQHMYFLVCSRNMPFWTKKVTSSFLAGRSCEYYFEVFTLEMEIGRTNSGSPNPKHKLRFFENSCCLKPHRLYLYICALH